MRVPSNMSEEEVVSTINKVASRLAHKFTFAFYELEDIKQEGLNPTLAFDDRDQVVKMWRGLGIECFQVREGDF